MAEHIINIERLEQVQGLFGNMDENIRLIEKEFSVRIVFRGGEIRISGDEYDVSRAVQTVEGLITLLNKGEALEVAPIVAHRWTEQYEALREATVKAAEEGKNVCIDFYGNFLYNNFDPF